jgi:uncharacterized protein (DUF2141 family)
MHIRIIQCALILILLLILANVLSAENDKYKIEGEIVFTEKGKIYIYLVNEKIFQTPFTGLQTIILKPKEKDIARQKIAFTFHDVKKGTYGIRCFQDQNDDGKLNKGMFGPTEPWGMSWKGEKVIRWPSFDKIEFEVTSDIKNLKITLE